MKDTINIIKAVLRENIDWEDSKEIGLKIPKAVENVDISLMHPEKLYPDFEKRQDKLNKQRDGILKEYKGLSDEVKNVFNN